VTRRYGDAGKVPGNNLPPQADLYSTGTGVNHPSLLAQGLGLLLDRVLLDCTAPDARPWRLRRKLNINFRNYRQLNLRHGNIHLRNYRQLDPRDYHPAAHLRRGAGNRDGI
jgi:hypothetical protein